MADQEPTNEPTQEQPVEEQQEQEPEAATGSPSDFLKQVVGEQVVVRLNSGVDYRGECSCCSASL